MKDALILTSGVGGAALGLLTAIYMFGQGMKTKPERPSGYFWFVAWPLICGVGVGFCAFLLVLIAVALAGVILSQHIALGLGAVAGLIVAVRENGKQGENVATTLKNVAGLVVACAFLAGLGWTIIQGTIQCGGSCITDREDLYRGR